MNSLKSNTNTILRSRQRLTPLFILAFSLAGIGGYTSYHSLIIGRDYSQTVPITAPPVMALSILEDISEELSNEEVSDGMNLYYRAGNIQHFEMQMRQQNEYEESGTKRMVDTILNLTWRDQVRDTEVPGRLAIDREFGSILIEVVEQNKPVGADITQQLGILLSGTQSRLTMSDRGLIKSKEWVSETNAQTAQSLHLLDDAFRLVNPHFLREAVHVGEEWTYWLRTSAEDATPERLEADGALEVSNYVAGTVQKNHRTYAVIVQKITGNMRGVFDGVTDYTIEGKGRGLVLFDIEAGILYSSHLELERTIRIDGKSSNTDWDADHAQTSKIGLYLVQSSSDEAIIN